MVNVRLESLLAQVSSVQQIAALAEIEALERRAGGLAGERECCVARPEAGLVANRLAVTGCSPELFRARPMGEPGDAEAAGSSPLTLLRRQSSRR